MCLANNHSGPAVFRFQLTSQPFMHKMKAVPLQTKRRKPVRCPAPPPERIVRSAAPPVSISPTSCTRPESITSGAALAAAGGWSRRVQTSLQRASSLGTRMPWRRRSGPGDGRDARSGAFVRSLYRTLCFVPSANLLVNIFPVASTLTISPRAVYACAAGFCRWPGACDDVALANHLHRHLPCTRGQPQVPLPGWPVHGQ
jgi:hypothetical protein